MPPSDICGGSLTLRCGPVAAGRGHSEAVVFATAFRVSVDFGACLVWRSRMKTLAVQHVLESLVW